MPGMEIIRDNGGGGGRVEVDRWIHREEEMGVGSGRQCVGC